MKEPHIPVLWAEMTETPVRSDQVLFIFTESRVTAALFLSVVSDEKLDELINISYN